MPFVLLRIKSFAAQEATLRNDIEDLSFSASQDHRSSLWRLIAGEQKCHESCWGSQVFFFPHCRLSEESRMFRSFFPLMMVTWNKSRAI